MRVAAISDIHGNLPALEAVLADIERETVDAIVVVGDSFSGPWPAEVVDLLAEVGALVVRGNADRLDVIASRRQRARGLERRALGEARLAAAAAWPLTMELDVDGLGDVLVCHATPVLRRADPHADHARRRARGASRAGRRRRRSSCGHTHMQYDRVLSSGLRVVNPGSVGMPYEGRPGAFWALLGPDVEFRRTEYDVVATVGRDPRAAVTGARGAAWRSSSIRRRRTTTTEYFESLRGA